MEEKKDFTVNAIEDDKLEDVAGGGILNFVTINDDGSIKRRNIGSSPTSDDGGIKSSDVAPPPFTFGSSGRKLYSKDTYD